MPPAWERPTPCWRGWEVSRQSEGELRQLRANLLRAISHDLRIPLTSISDNARILTENGAALNTEKRRGLYASIYDDAMWLVNLVENLLSIIWMENGSMKLNIQSEPLDEVFQKALGHLDRNAAHHEISAELTDNLLMADMDARLIVHAIISLINNAIKHTPSVLFKEGIGNLLLLVHELLAFLLYVAKAAHIMLAINRDRRKGILSVWISGHESASFGPACLTT